jgi:hypothetical protein
MEAKTESVLVFALVSESPVCEFQVGAAVGFAVFDSKTAAVWVIPVASRSYAIPILPLLSTPIEQATKPRVVDPAPATASLKNQVMAELASSM